MNIHPADEAGTIVRTIRRMRGLTLAQLGKRVGYSAAQISRLERGLVPLSDTRLLRRFAIALAVSPRIFGLIPDDRGSDPPGYGPGGLMLATGHSVASEPNEDGDGPVRRRELLGVAAVGALGVRLSPRAEVGNPAGGLEHLLYGPGVVAEPTSLPRLRSAAEAARGLFETTRYDRLAAGLPKLIATAAATRDHSDGTNRLTADALLADAYITAANFMVKLNDDHLAWALADRGLRTAEASGDMLTLADARRIVAVVLRRTGRRATAHDLLTRAADQLTPGRHATAGQLSMRGTLLQTAAYTAAVDGDRSSAAELIAAAKADADRLGMDVNHRHLVFGPTNVALYEVSIAQVLGDNGAAIARAKTVRPDAIPTPERHGRYWIDVARAYHQWNKLDRCYQALRAAERAAPGEIRYRPPVRRMTEGLLHADRGHLPGLRAFAGRVGIVR